LGNLCFRGGDENEGRSSLPIHSSQDLRVDTNGMKGVGGIEFAWGCKQ